MNRQPLLASILFVVGAVVTHATLAEESKVKEGAREVGHTVGTAAREVGKETKKATREVGKTVAEAARETGHAFRDGAKEFKKAVHGETPTKPASKDTAK